MDLPLRLMNGEWLYRDVHYLYPPFSPYFNALLYRIFGARLGVLQAGGLVCSILIVWLCYRIARKLLTPSEATLALIAIILLGAFKPGGNLIWPYAFAALHGAVFTLGALLLTLRYAESEKRRELIFAGILIGLLTVKPQMGLLIPICLIAGGYGRAFVSASITGPSRPSMMRSS